MTNPIPEEDRKVIYKEAVVDGVRVTVHQLPDVTVNEVKNYLELLAKNVPEGSRLTSLSIAKTGNDDHVALDYTLQNPPMERIRRITGYLVGTVDRWNNAKQAELRDRVKHSTREFSR